MSDVLTQRIAAGGQAIYQGGLFFKIIKAPFPVGVVAERVKAGVGDAIASSAPSGYTLGPVPETRRFSRITVSSAVDQDVTVIIGDDVADVTDFQVELSRAARAGGNQCHPRRTALPQNIITQIPFNASETITTFGFWLSTPSTNTANVAILKGGVVGDFADRPQLEPGRDVWLPFGWTGVAAPAVRLQALATVLNQSIDSLQVFHDTNLVG